MKLEPINITKIFALRPGFERESEGNSELVFYSQATLGKGLCAAIDIVSYFSKIDKDDKSAGEESDTSDDDTGEGVDP